MTTNDLIDTAGIAALLGVTRAYATDRITKRADFPAPVIDVSERTRRWNRDDVLRWASGGRDRRKRQEQAV